MGGDGWYISLYSATRGHCQLLSPSELLPIGESAEEVYDTISACIHCCIRLEHLTEANRLSWPPLIISLYSSLPILNNRVNVPDGPGSVGR